MRSLSTGANRHRSRISYAVHFVSWACFVRSFFHCSHGSEPDFGAITNCDCILNQGCPSSSSSLCLKAQAVAVYTGHSSCLQIHWCFLWLGVSKSREEKGQGQSKGYAAALFVDHAVKRPALVKKFYRSSVAGFTIRLYPLITSKLPLSSLLVH